MECLHLLQPRMCIRKYSFAGAGPSVACPGGSEGHFRPTGSKSPLPAQDSSRRRET